MESQRNHGTSLFITIHHCSTSAGPVPDAPCGRPAPSGRVGLCGRLPAAQRLVLVRRAGHDTGDTGETGDDTGDGVPRGGEEAVEAKSWLGGGYGGYGGLRNYVDLMYCDFIILYSLFYMILTMIF